MLSSPIILTYPRESSCIQIVHRTVLRRIHVVAKSANFLRHVRSSVRQSACINAAPKGRICVKFDFGDFLQNLSREYKLDQNRK